MPATYLPPSFSNGFARSASQARRPRLWSGLIGAWMPCIGPTGGTLRDFTHHRHDGTLTNMAVADDWVRSEGRWALDFDGTDDFVNFGDYPDLTGATKFTIGMFVYPRTVGARQVLLHKFATGPGQGFTFEINSSDLRAFVAQDAADAGGNFIAGAHGMSVDTWYHVSFIYNGASSLLTVNGKSISASITGSLTAAVVDGAQDMCLGATAGAALPFNGMIDSLTIYDRATAESSQIATRRGIVFEKAPRRVRQAQVAVTRRYGVIGGGVHYSGV